MSVEIDKRVVEMQFDNKQFERNVQASLTTIDKLKMALDFDGAKGLEDMTKAANKMDLSNVTKQTEAVRVQFSALQIAGVTMISELTKSFLNFGKNIWNMSLGQMKSGGMARTLKIEQAEFKLKALAKNILKVEEDSAELTAYVEKMSKAASDAVNGTAYGYDSAMSTVSQLVASGINDAEVMERYLMGIAGAAAMTGRSFDDIGNIFSTVASNGKLMTQQLRQFSFAGFNVAAVLADNLGKTETQITEMIQKGQISFETFAEVIAEAYGGAAQKADDTYAGVTSNIKAQLSRVGQLFTDPYVKHMIPFLKAVKSGVKQLRTALEPTAKRFDFFFERLTQWGTKIVESLDFSRLDIVVRGMENLLLILAGIAYTIHQAFAEVFDKRTLGELRAAALEFERLTEALIPTDEVLLGIKTSFKFLFSILKIGTNVLGSLKSAFKPILISVARILGAIISLVRHLEPLSNFIIRLLKESKLLEAVAEIIANIIVAVCDGIIILISILDELFGKFVNISTFKRIGEVLVDISRIISSAIVVSLLLVYAAVKKIMALVNPEEIFSVINGVGSAFGYLINMVIFFADTVINFIHTLLNSDTLIGDFLNVLKELFGLISDIARGKDLEERLGNLNRVLGEIGASFKKFMSDFRAQMKDITMGKIMLIAFSIGAIMLVFSLQRLIEAMVMFTNTAKNTINIGATINRAFNSFANYSPAAQTLITFAIAVAALSTALVTLSQVEDTEKLITSAKILGAFAAGLLATAVALTLAYKYFAYTGQGGNVASLAFVMMGIAASLMLLVVAVKTMAGLTVDLHNMLSVCASIISIMMGLSVAVGIMAKLAPNFQASMWSILAFAGATMLLVKTLNILRGFDIAAIWKQAILLGGLMIVLGLAVGLAGKAAESSREFNNKNGTSSSYKRGSAGGSLLAFAISMEVLLDVFKKLCAIPTKQLEIGIENIKKVIMSFIPLIVSLAIINKLSGTDGSFIADTSSMFASLAIAMGVIFAAVALFASLPASDISQGVNAMKEIMSSLGTMMMQLMLVPLLIAAISSSAQKATGKQLNTGTGNIFTNLKGIIIAISGMLLAISVMCMIIKDVPHSAIEDATWMITVIGVIVGFISVASRFTSNAKASPIIASLFTIMAIVGAIAFLAAVISTGGIDVKSVVLIGTVLSAIFVALGVMFTGMGFLQQNTPRRETGNSGAFGGIVLILGIVAGLVGILKFAKDVDFAKLIAIFAGMTVLTAAIVVLFHTISKLDTQQVFNLGKAFKIVIPVIAMFATMVTSFIALALVLNRVSDDAWGKALVTLGIISLLMLSMGVVMDKAAENVGYFNDISGIMAMMWSMVGMVAVLGLVITAVAAAPTNKGYVAKLIALSVLVGAMMIFLDRCDFSVGSMESMAHMKVFAESFAIMCAGILAIAGAIVLVTKADFGQGTLWGAKLGILALGIAAVAGILILVATFTNSADALNMGVASASFVGICIGLVLIAESIKRISEIPMDKLAKAGQVLIGLTVIFGLIIAVAAALGAIPGVGTSVAIAIGATAGAFLLFGLALLSVSKSIDIFANSMHKFAALTVDDIEQIVDNIETFLTKIPSLVSDMEYYGHDVARAIALLIINAADAVGMASGAIIGAALQFVVSFCAGILEALPTILDTVGKIIEAIAQWILTDGKVVLYDAGKALMEGVISIAKGLIDGLFEYFGLKVDDLLASINDAKKAAEEADDVKYNAYTRTKNSMITYWSKLLGEDNGMTYGQKVWQFFDMMQDRIDAGVISYADAVKIMGDIGLDEYAEYLNRADDISNYYLESGETVIKRYEDNVSEEGKALVNTLKQDYEKAKEYANGFVNTDNVNKYISELNSAIRSGKITYRYALKSLYDEGLQEYSSQLDKGDYRGLGSTVTEELADGTADNIDDVEKAVDGVASAYEDGADRIEVASNRANKASSSFGQAGNIAFAMQGANIDLNQAAKMRQLTQSSQFAEMVGEATANGAEEGFVNETEKSNYILDTINKYGPKLKLVGLDLGEFLGDGMIDSFSSRADVIGAILGGLNQTVTGQKYMTADQVRKYWAEEVEYFDEEDEIFKKRARWKGQYESYEAAVRDNTHAAGDWLKELIGAKDAEEVLGNITSDLTGNVGDLTDALNEEDEAARKAKERLDQLKDTVASSLDIFSEFNKETELTGQQVLKNFLGQIEGVTEWSEMLIGLADKGVAQPIIAKLEEAGPSSYEQVHAIYNMSTKRIALLNAMYADSEILADKSIDIIEARMKQMVDGSKKIIPLWPETVEEFDAQFKESGEVIAEELVNGIAEAESTEDAGKEIVDKISEGVIEEVPELRKAFIYMTDSVMETLKKELAFEDALTAVKDFRDELAKSIKGSFNIFDDFQEEEEISTTKMLYNMAEQTKKVGRWANNLALLASRGMSEGLLESLRELGPQGAAKVEAFAKMSASELKKANNLYAASASVPTSAADKLVSAYAKAGYQTSLGFAEGIDPEAAADVMYQLGTTSLTSLQKSLGIHSPSKATYGVGVNTILGLSEGLGDPDALAELEGSIMTFGERVKEMFDEALSDVYLADKLYKVGSSLADSKYESKSSLSAKRPVTDFSNIRDYISMPNFTMPSSINLEPIKSTLNNSSGALATISNNTNNTNNLLRDMNNEMRNVQREVNSLRADTINLGNRIDGMYVRLDGNALVGQIINPLDTKLGSKSIKNARRRV